ncbi:DUF3944 domain-containing protein [Citrobacter freundii]
MAVYREDADLRFLGRCENEDLDLLVSLITRDPRDNTLRWTETLSCSDNYKRFHPAHRNYWQEIAAESRPSVPAALPICSGAGKACCTGKCYAMSVTIRA